MPIKTGAMKYDNQIDPYADDGEPSAPVKKPNDMNGTLLAIAAIYFAFCAGMMFAACFIV